MPKITLGRTIERIAARSFVQAPAGPDGFGLVPTPAGFELSAHPELHPGALPERVVLTREDGRPLPHGYILTERELKRAVREILSGV